MNALHVAAAEGVAGRGLILVAAAAAGLAAWLAYALYRRRGGDLDSLDIAELDLELMAGCCALVVFTSPACHPCKAAVTIARSAAAGSPGTEVRTVDATERPELALRYDVRTIPTTFLITASGHVLRRWRHVPSAADVQAALGSV